MNKHYFICDLETTGFDPIRNDVIEICIIVTDSNRVPINEFYSKVKPPIINNITWSESAEKVHGISVESLEHEPSRRDVCIKLLNFLKPYKDPDNFPQPFVFHANGFFDFNFLEWMYRKETLEYSFWKMFSVNKAVSTIKLARAETAHNSHGLAVWAERLGFDLKHHSAQSDTLCCLKIYDYLMKDYTDEKKVY